MKTAIQRVQFNSFLLPVVIDSDSFKEGKKEFEIMSLQAGYTIYDLRVEVQKPLGTGLTFSIKTKEGKVDLMNNIAETTKHSVSSVFLTFNTADKVVFSASGVPTGDVKIIIRALVFAPSSSTMES
ncbi:hypothetical protein [Helicobacter sp. 11S02596-1]|uniref:hypothetical protein n=1 Tax=Helicobacter sp. 11S02596-1 TaxID=1476194 RepID=UPI000BA7B901|nr:hypothetical protein [Helicobacter sp. 11S02596-1]PAF41369.1 hypothetical protein BJI48_08745 [Helicobacter sp. 11S02596-1]